MLLVSGRGMMLALMSLPFAIPLLADPINCIPKASLQSYEDLGASGCVLGNFTLSSFTFSALSASGESVANPSQVFVDNLVAGSFANLFLYSLPNPTEGDFLHIELRFNIQPNSSEFLGSMSGRRTTVDSNNLLTGPFPAGVNMVVEGCFGGVFVENQICPGVYWLATDESTLSSPGTMSESTFRLSVFVPGNTAGNQVFWDVGAILNGPLVPTPEPGSGVLVPLGLLALGFVATRLPATIK